MCCHHRLVNPGPCVEGDRSEMVHWLGVELETPAWQANASTTEPPPRRQLNQIGRVWGCFVPARSRQPIRRKGQSLERNQGDRLRVFFFRK